MSGRPLTDEELEELANHISSDSEADDDIEVENVWDSDDSIADPDFIPDDNDVEEAFENELMNVWNETNAPQTSRNETLSPKLKPLSRQAYNMMEFHKELCSPQQIYCLQNTPNMSRSLKRNIAEVLKQEEPTEHTTEQNQKGKRTYCSTCPSAKKRMTVTYCPRYKKPICGEHQVKICQLRLELTYFNVMFFVSPFFVKHFAIIY
nr:unnamed protein product [Callosobruchus chinensis]